MVAFVALLKGFQIAIITDNTVIDICSNSLSGINNVNSSVLTVLCL